MEEIKKYPFRCLRAINRPLRLEFLRALNKGEVTFEGFGARTGMEEKSFIWHLSLLLKHGFCVARVFIRKVYRY